MKIKYIRLDEFGPYRNWSFKPGEQGVQLLYGANESGKTSLLEGIRTLLFGGKAKQYGPCTGSLDVERDGKDFHIGRKGKQLDFYPFGEARIDEEPVQLWWHGLDRKTYNRVFGLTLDDLQGTDVLSEVEVRARFFGAEGGGHLGTAVKHIEKNANDLLVASVNGKRRINVLLDELKENRRKIAELSRYEEEYVQLEQALADTEETERELQRQLREWRDYREGVDVVLRAWDTYRRSEEARVHMQQYNEEQQLEREEFLRIDEDLKSAREYMKTWQEKETALMPENFSPDNPFAFYGQDIEDFIQEAAKWEQLRRECEEGDAYIAKVKEQLAFSRGMQSAWRDDEIPEDDVNWVEGERLSRRVRSAKDRLLHWEERKPAEDGGTVTETDDDAKRIETLHAELETVNRKRESLLSSKAEAEQQTAGLTVPTWLQRIGGIGAVAGVLLILVGLVFFESALYSTVGFLLLTVSIGLFWYASKMRHKKQTDTAELLYELNLLTSQTSDLEYQLESLLKTSKGMSLQDLTAHMSPLQSWIQEGNRLQKDYDEALEAWRTWLPRGAAKSLGEDDFFGMKQEYDQYRQQVQTIEGYEKRLEEHKNTLALVEDRAALLWRNLGIEAPVTPTELKRIYNQYKLFRQNKIRWEQKEEQRQSFRREYDNWHRKEKELLLRQKELMTRAGMETSGEYRQKLINEDQLKQWQTIYKQSQIQLELLAPDAENRDLFYRRLRDGNKDNWVDELNHTDREMTTLENSLATLYERRGQIVESMRALGTDREQFQALQRRRELETDLEQALEDWAVQVLIGHCMNQAQQNYEAESQPHMLELASRYVNRLTGGAYTLDMTDVRDTVALLDNRGERLEARFWSSGLGDQVYLALRLALAKVFSRQVDNLPIILDDILVCFDEDRQLSALKLLSEIGQEQQIWIFTCQRHIYDMAGSVEGIDTHVLQKGLG